MTEETIHIEQPFRGKVFSVEVQTVKMHDGREASREIVRHGGGACVAAIDDANRIYMVSQFRKPFDEVLMEIPAGKLEPGEDPVQCAKRELQEETGLRAQKMNWLATIYPSPGYCSETLTIYLATGLSQGDASPDDGEHLVCKAYDLAEVLSMLDRGEIRDAKTQVALLTLGRKFGLKTAGSTGGEK